MKISLLIAIIGLGLIGTVNAQNYNTMEKFVKIAPLAPLLNSTSLSYEQKLNDYRSIEARIGIIGLGMNILSPGNRSGFSASIGPKLYFKKKNKEVKSTKLEGLYFKPELIYSSICSSTDDINFLTLKYNFKAQSGALILNLGKQLYIRNRIVLDFSAGLGYGLIERTSTASLPPRNTGSNSSHLQLFGGGGGSSSWFLSDYTNFHSHLHGHNKGHNENPLAAKLNFSIGFLLH